MSVPEVLKRALSIRQPFAEQIVRGDRANEFRSKITHIRGRVYVYATKNWQLDVEGAEYLGDPADLPRGEIVGSVEIVGCAADPAGGFAWKLANPRRYEPPVTPLGMPQPGFWHPTFVS